MRSAVSGALQTGRRSGRPQAASSAGGDAVRLRGASADSLRGGAGWDALPHATVFQGLALACNECQTALLHFMASSVGTYVWPTSANWKEMRHEISSITRSCRHPPPRGRGENQGRDHHSRHREGEAAGG